MTEKFIPPHGGYEKLLSFQKARIVYDGTVWFCKHFLEKRDRTYDQMIQAARSGKQNILEGSQASGTSKAMEIKLTNVARASLEELLEDYRDYLRTRRIEEWTKDHAYTRRLRQLNRQPNATYETFKKGIEHSDPAIAANVMIGLIKLTNYLLDRQLRQLEKAFVEEGGLRERMTRARLTERGKQNRRFSLHTNEQPSHKQKRLASSTRQPLRDIHSTRLQLHYYAAMRG
jgi:four helix bundle suffix protein